MDEGRRREECIQVIGGKARRKETKAMMSVGG
jgi:hypothetical protein